MATETARLVRWNDVTKEQLNPLLTRQFITGEQAMVSQLELKKGCAVPAHAHHNEQITMIVSGTLKFTLGEGGATEELIVRAGEVLVIPSNLRHGAVAIEDTVDIDIFAPPRQDWITGTDAYLR
jgi:quercetin dioxygenase-like cupin family protein